MNYIGVLLLVISLISFLSVFAFHKFTKRLYSKYWFYLVVSIFYLTYFIIFRYSINIKEFINFNIDDYSFNVKEYARSFTFSKVFLLDLCPMMSILLPLSLIFDKTRNVAKVFSLFGLLGGLVTIFSNLIFVKEINVNIFQFIFIGESPNYLFFFSHYFIALLSLIVLSNSKKFTKWSVLGTILFLFLFISYILIVSNSLSIKCNTTGLTEGDWYNPYPSYIYWYSQYNILYKLTPWDYWVCAFFWYSIAGILIVLFMMIKNIFTKSELYSSTTIWWSKLDKINTYIDKKIKLIFRENKNN